MTLHFCTMLECILLYIVFLTVTTSVSAIKIRKFPFGPLMCDRLCRHTVDCKYFFYAPQDLTCYRGSTSTALDIESLNITVSKVGGNASMDISKCPKHSKIYQSRSRKPICFKQNDRRNTSFSETPCTLHSTETKTTKTADHVYVFCNESIKLYHASKHGKLGRVKSIIRQGLEDINCREKKKKMTPVMAAARSGEGEVFDFLVCQGCLLSGVDFRRDNLLHLACLGGNTGIVRKLVVDKAFDVERRGYHGQTPMMIAAEYGNQEVFDFLMKRCNNMKIVNYYHETFLHYACYNKGYKNMKIVKHILSLNIPGIDVYSRGYHGRTPIMAAANHGNREVFDVLMNRGSNMKIVDDDHNTILHVACKQHVVEMVEYILSLNIPGIDIECRGYHGRTPIMAVAKHGYRKVFDVLMNRGSNMKIVDDDHNTILHVACQRYDMEMVEYVLSLNIPGIDIESRGSHGRTPIMIAAEYGKRQVFDFLMKRGSDIKLVDYNKDTILHVACNNRKWELVKYIRSLNIPGMDVDKSGNNGC